MAECEECRTDLGGSRDEIFKLRYAFSPEEDWKTACDRVSRVIGSAENGGLREEWIPKFKEILENFYFIPGGRIIRNSGRQRGMLLNCFALDVEDNRESIGLLFNEGFVVSGSGGGIGINWSKLRPIGDMIHTAGGVSSGAISFMEALDGIGNTVESGGQRRAAFIAVLNATHPEVFDFLKAKVIENRLTHFNISVGITNEFLKAVKRNKNWDLTFGTKVYNTVPARELWDMIVENAWKCADPGILNITNLQKYNNLWWCEDLQTTNPCGEIPLPPYGSCCLGSINLSEMYDPITNGVNWSKFKEVVTISVRFLDNVLDVTDYPIKKIELSSRATRRIGLGVMGLHYLLLKMGIKNYGSDESLEFMDELFNKMRDYAYLASVKLAEEKSSFEKLDLNNYLDGEFVKELPRRILTKIKKHGIRNATILTMPPTGTTSMVAGVSSGLEPIFSPVYKRKFRTPGESGKGRYKENLEVDPLFRQFVEDGIDTSHFIGAYEIDPFEHMQVQATCQKYVCNSISKTINMAENYPVSKLNELLLEYGPMIKGTTLYRQGCKGTEILTPVDHTKMTREEILKISPN